MTTRLVVVGAGGFGRETLDVIEAINAASPAAVFDVVGIVDDRPAERNLARLSARGYRWLGTITGVLTTSEPGAYALAVGSPSLRQEIAAKFAAAQWTPATLVHPSAVIGSAARLGAGSIICSGVQVSTNVTLGDLVHLNPNATIGHDANLGDFVSVNPAAIISGEVTIDPVVLVGAGAVVLQGLQVGTGATIGAAACVTGSVEPGLTVVGVPARSITEVGR